MLVSQEVLERHTVNFKPPPLRIVFGADKLGVLEEVDGKLVFSGNADESAKLFFEHVIKQWEANRAIHNSN